MFKNEFSIKAVKKYGQPAYPVIDEDGRILFYPHQVSKISKIAKEFSTPVVGLAFATIMSQSVQASPLRKPEEYVAESIVGEVDEDTPTCADQDDKKISYRIKRFTKRQTNALIEELNLKIKNNEHEHVRGIRIMPTLSMTEGQARRILEKFFRKNGIMFENDVEFKRDKVDFKLDAYNKEKKVGWEFDYLSKQDLSKDEISKLKSFEKEKKEHILLIEAANFMRLPSGNEGIKRLQKTAEDFLTMLYNRGVLKCKWMDDKEIDQLLKNLDSGDDKKKSQSYQELASQGITIIDRLKKDKKSVLVQKLIAEIESEFDKKVNNYFKQLDSDDPQIRDQATKELIEMDEDAQPFVKKLLELAKQNKSEEVRSRVEMVQKEIE